MNSNMEINNTNLQGLGIISKLLKGEWKQQFEEIIEFYMDLYQQDNREWVFTYSGGKDSSLLCDLGLEAIKRLPKEDRIKRVHIVSADTKVETREMTSYQMKNLKLMKDLEEELNIEVHLVQPEMKDSFFFNVVGKGVVCPKPPSPFQWCTGRMKITPMNKTLKEIIREAKKNSTNSFLESWIEEEKKEKKYDVVMFLGSRLDESARRAKSINKYVNKEDVFGENIDFPNVLNCYPIKYVTTDDLWDYVLSKRELVWGLPSDELYAMYSSATECPMMGQELEGRQCGASNSRNGCWVCLYAGKRDKMLLSLLDEDSSIKHLMDWKAFLYDVTFDVRYREPLRKDEVKKQLSELAAQQAVPLTLLDLLEEDEEMREFKSFDRATQDQYKAGGYTFELRLMLLQKLLYVQQEVGYKLIEQEEIEAILGYWKEEGWSFTMNDIIPVNHQYDGPVVLNTSGNINKKQTTNDNKVFFIDIELTMGQAEMIEYHKKRQRETGKSYFCFFKHNENEAEKFVYNFMRFIVCKEGIQTEGEAQQEIFDWLFGSTDNGFRPFNSKESQMILNLISIRKKEGMLDKHFVN